MKTRAVRLYGKNDLRLEEFELPEIQSGEILIKIISDSVCMSIYKIAIQGEKHIRVPDNVKDHPAIMVTHIDLPLTAIDDFETLGNTDDRFKALADIVKRNKGLWCTEAEQYLLEHFS